MRVIKFRVWDKKEKKMILFNEFKGFMDLEGTIWTIDKKGISKERERYIPLQFIGICDKDKKEIYEGDIVRGERLTYSCGDETREEMEEKKNRKKEYGIGYIKWDDRELTYEVYTPTPSYKYSKEGLTRIYPSTFKVIGNVYKNPKLLEGWSM